MIAISILHLPLALKNRLWSMLYLHALPLSPHTQKWIDISINHTPLPSAEPPVLAELKFPPNLVEGMRLSVACSLLSGDLPITLSWQRDGLPLPRDPLLTETHSQFFSNLVFADIRGKHAGTYTCTASNAAAASTVSASMNVQGKEDRGREWL